MFSHRSLVSRGSSLAAALAVTAFVALAGTASASMVSAIGVNISNYGNGKMATTDLAGAPGVRVDNWNNLTGASTNLHTANLTSGSVVDNTGSVQPTVSVSMVWPGNGGPVGMGSITSGGNDTNLYANVEDQWTPTAGTFTMSGLTYSNYDVYVYVYNDSANPGRGGSISIGSTTYWIATGAAAGNPTSSGTGYVISTDTAEVGGGSSALRNTVGNYVEFTGLSGSSFTASYLASGVVNGGARLKIAGFQVVDTTAIPEPPVLGLVLAGALALLLVKRNKASMLG